MNLPTTPYRLRRRHRRGLGLIELLIALAISASLLTAVAVAVNASFMAYRINTTQSDLMQRSRIALHRLTSTLRVTVSHAPVNTTPWNGFVAGQTVQDVGITMADDAGVTTSFIYDPVEKTLRVIHQGSTYTLLDGVEQFDVTLEPMRSSASARTGGGWDLLRRATITLTVRPTNRTRLVGTDTGDGFTLSTSVMPRRNAW